MPYSDLEILSGVLVASCLLLLWCRSQKQQSYYEGYKAGHVVPGLKFTKKSGFYTPTIKKQGLTSAKSLNGVVTVPTPCSSTVQMPTGREGEILWMPDATIPLDIYSRDGNVDESVQLSAKDETDLYQTVFKNAPSRVGTGSLCGSILTLTDYGSNTRDVTY